MGDSEEKGGQVQAKRTEDAGGCQLSEQHKDSKGWQCFQHGLKSHRPCCFMTNGMLERPRGKG